MHFCSVAYLLFFVFIFSAYWLIPSNKVRNYLLLVASFYFYATWNSWLAVLVVASSSLDFFLAIQLEKSSKSGSRKAYLIASVLANMGLLCYFKYANFFLESLKELLSKMGLETHFSFFSIVIPIGISFYTFEAISYMADVYSRKISAEKRLPNFLLFILFFPHLVAGPIVRSRDFLPQIRKTKIWNWSRMHLGLQMVLMGLFKKLVIADRMAFYADPVFADPDGFRQGALWIGMIAYALQIYGDFSGYTDMAIGFAHMLGFKLTKNFNMPYLAVNISDFWRRWHISLSSWLRDYLFIPLGGSRGGLWLTCRNLMITMTLGGLWHGASWNFVVWGMIHGALLVCHKLFTRFCENWVLLQSLLLSRVGTAFRIALTFLCVSVIWVFFRAQTFADSMSFLHGLFVPHAGKAEPMNAVGLLLIIFLVAVAHVSGVKKYWQSLYQKIPAPVLGMVYALFLNFCLFVAPPVGKPFIYFQF